MEDQGFYTSKGRFVDRIEGMKIAHACGQVSDEVAFSKKWHKIKLNTTDREPIDWDMKDTEKYNRLFSEDLYQLWDLKRIVYGCLIDIVLEDVVLPPVVMQEKS